MISSLSMSTSTSHTALTLTHHGPATKIFIIIINKDLALVVYLAWNVPTTLPPSLMLLHWFLLVLHTFAYLSPQKDLA